MEGLDAQYLETQFQETQLEQQRIFEQAQRFNDPVNRDVMMGDWNINSHGKEYSKWWGIVIFLVAVLLMLGAYMVFTHAQSDSQTPERYRQEIIKKMGEDSVDCMNVDSQTQYDKILQQMKVCLQKKERRDNRCLCLIIVCAVAPALFVGYVVYSYLRRDGYKPRRSELVLVSVVTIFLAIVLYLSEMAYFYARFYSTTKERSIIWAFVAVMSAALLWYFGRRRKKRKK